MLTLTEENQGTMIEKDERFTLAERYVEETGVSVFLTGKAGTGKTTFLKEIVRQTSKRFAVAGLVENAIRSFA